jgi:hypothetical protein
VKSSLSENTFVAVTDALRERFRNKTGWLIVPGVQEFADTSLWNTKEPGDVDSNQDCAMHAKSSAKLHDVSCSGVAAYRCQYQLGSPRVSRRLSSFRLSDIVEFEQPSVGCASAILDSSDMTRCTLLCHWSIGCVGFLFNHIRLQCILLNHFDASVQLPFHSTEEKLAWKKMLADWGDG